MRMLFSHLTKELRQWSLAHYFFDGCLTGLISVVLAAATTMPWYFLVPTILFAFGTVTSGIALARGALTVASPDAVQSKNAKIKAALEGMVKEIRGFDIEHFEEFRACLTTASCRLEAMFREDQDCVRLFRNVIYDRGPDHFDTSKASTIAYLDGLVTRL